MANAEWWRSRRRSSTASIDLALSWSERELPERERTKHVHRLHPYLGKFVPQLVEALLERYVRPGGRVLDPFAGSGTTLVQALESGYDAVGVDIAAFNALLVSVKTREHDLESLDADVRDVGEAAGCVDGAADRLRRRVVRAAGRRRAAALPLADRGATRSQDVLRVVLARAARSARLTTHFDLDFPRAPQQGEYWCHKHRRTCRPVETRGQVPLPLPDRHRSADSRPSPRCAIRGGLRSCCTATRGSSSSAARTTGSSPRRRIPA